MKSTVVTLALLLSSCALEDAAPDTMNIGLMRHEADADVWNGDGIHSAHGEGEGYSYGISFGWKFGPQQPRHERDYDLMEQAMTRALVEHARSMPKAETPSISIGTPAISPVPMIGPPVPEDHQHHWYEFFALYADADIATKIIIAFLMMAFLVCAVLYRRTLVQLLMFWKGKDKKEESS